MSWASVGKKIAMTAPLLGTALGGPVGAAIGSIVAAALGTTATPEAVTAALSDPTAASRLTDLEESHATELRKAILTSETERITTINATIRAEAVSGDKFVRRWRPFFGYAVGIAWLLQTLTILVGCLYAVFSVPERSGEIMSALGGLIGALTAQWSVALAVLGVAVRSRSGDKLTCIGKQPKSLIDTLFNRSQIRDSP